MSNSAWREVLSVRNKHAAKLAMDIRKDLPEVVMQLAGLDARPGRGHEARKLAIQSITADDLLEMLLEAAEQRRGLLPGSLQRPRRSRAPTHTTNGAGV